MTTTAQDTIVIRRAGAADSAAVRELAALDSSPVPHGELLVLEAGGRLRAALAIADGTYVADPFSPTRELVALLDAHAARLREPAGGRLVRARARLALWSDLWWRAAQARPSL